MQVILIVSTVTVSYLMVILKIAFAFVPNNEVSHMLWCMLLFPLSRI